MHLLDATLQFSIVGTIAIIAVALMGYTMALSWEKFCSYGRETLVAFATFVLYTGIIRLLFQPFHVVGQDEARFLNGLGGIVLFAGGLQTIYFHWTWHRLKGHEHDKPPQSS